MKTEISMIWVKRLYPMHVQAYYGTLFEILRGCDPTYYNAGIYGWNNDVYTLHTSDGETIAISSGYRNTRGTCIPGDVIEKYKAAALAIREKHYNEIGADAYQRELDAYEELRREFADEIQQRLFVV